MKNVISIKSLILVVVAIAVPGIASASTLLEIYQQALQSDPRIHEAEARRLAALEAKPQARGVYLPQIDFSGDWTNTNASNSGNIVIGDILVPSSSETDADTKRWQFNLRQTLFRWDQIVGLRRADKTVAKAEANREAAQQDLIVRVVQT